jgi:hypothetical protein
MQPSREQGGDTDMKTADSQQNVDAKSALSILYRSTVPKVR